MAANAEIFFEHDRWGRNLTWSLGLHIAVAGAIVLYAVVAPSSHGEGWGAGGGGDAMGVSLVSTVPLPANPVKTENVLANDSKGLTQSQPKPVEKRNAGRDSDSGQDHKGQAGAEDHRHASETAART